MKKILFLLISIVSSIGANAQIFPNIQRSVLTEDGVYTCGPCYSWAYPKLDSFKAKYGDKLIVFKKEIAKYGTNPLGTFLSGYMHLIGYQYFLNYTIYSPSMYVNHHFIAHDKGDKAFNKAASDRIDSTNAQAPIASPIFKVTKRTTDSIVIITKTKFLKATTGDYKVGVLLLQDSIYYDQAGSSTGYIYHMHQLTGPDFTSAVWANGNWDGMDSLCYTMHTGLIPANTIFTNTFRFKLRPTQVAKNIHPVVVVWRYDTVRMYHDSSFVTYDMWKLYNYVNANEIEGFGQESSVSQRERSLYTATVFPNPVTNTLSVKLEGVEDKVMLQLVSVNGQVVLESDVKDGQLLDVSNLSNGQYVYSFKVRGEIIANGTLTINK
ncbi:MAG: T9SS type A sorting domain-containing protein [Chitinophagales bacterium]|nr:T9SS type A sorting domain-containing protein [Chitinophagales bacterium]